MNKKWCHFELMMLIVNELANHAFEKNRKKEEKKIEQVTVTVKKE